MSETDDTDVLLLIPPNFFLVQSSGSDDSVLESSRTVVHKPISCTAQVLGKLVNQVHSLESRLDSLEISTSEISVHKDSDSFESRSERKYFTFPRRRRRKNLNRKKKQDASLTSFDSVSINNIPPLKLCGRSEPSPRPISDSLSMDGDLSSIVSTPTKKNDKLLLHEIDEFLTKVESYESPESKYKDIESSPEHVIKAAGEYLTSKLEEDVKLPSGRIVSSSVLDKYIYLVKSNTSSVTEKSTPAYKQYGEDSEAKLSHITKPELKSPSVRKLNFPENKDIQPTSTPKKPTSSYLDSFKPSSNKIYDRATKVLEQYKAQNYSRNTQSESYLSQKKDEFKMPQMQPYIAQNKDALKLTSLQNKLMDSLDTELLSLSELWGEKGEKQDRDVRLEEERMKREHCEAVIQQLQRKVLEQQEKLAVAIKVDRGKDAAITKLRDAWLKLTGSLDKAEERHRAALEKMIKEVDNFKMVADDAQKKTNHFEAELYKALDLAHDYQDKCKQLTQERINIQDNMNKALTNKDDIIVSKDKEIEVLKDNYETVMRLNKQSTDCVKNLEDAVEKEKTDHEATKTLIEEQNHKNQFLIEQMSILTQERDLLKSKVNEERSRCDILEKQLAEKHNLSTDMIRKCDMLDSEVKLLRKNLELQKNELKTHYQRQLEEAVVGKLNEFQEQLDHAEREMENDARAKENAIVDGYSKQIARIEEQHKLEVNLIEEKQKEEIKLYRLQLAQAAQKISLLESKLESFRRRRTQLAAQLHAVMETQWRQALQLLTTPTTPITPTTVTTTTTHDPPMLTHEFVSKPSLPSAQQALRPRQPLAADALNFDLLSDHELQHYVKLLLTKPPTAESPMAALGLGPPAEHEPLEEPTSDRPSERKDRDKDKARRSLHPNKPPWKS